MKRFLLLIGAVFAAGAGVFGATVTISELPALTTPATNDVVATVDVDDTSSAPSGTTKKLEWWRLWGSIFQQWDSQLDELSGGTITNLQVKQQLVVGTNSVVASLTNLVSLAALGKPILNPINGDWWATGSGGTASLGFAPLTITPMGSGTIAAVAQSGDHPASWLISSSAGTPNSGENLLTRVDNYQVRGGEVAWAIGRANATNDALNRIGFLDVLTSADPTDGAWIQLQNGFVFGRCANNSVLSDTATSNQISEAVFYNWLVHCQTNLVTFALLSEAGAVVWSDTVNTNIPTARDFGAGLQIMKINTNTPTARFTLDDFGMINTRALVR